MGSNECESLRMFVSSCGGVTARGGKADQQSNNECESVWLFVLSSGVVTARGGKVDQQSNNECESLWLFVLSCGVFLLEAGGWTEHGGGPFHHHFPSARSCLSIFCPELSQTALVC